MIISTRSKAALGVNYVEKVVNLNDDILTRIPQENDRGLDLVIEYKDDKSEFYTFSAQVKSGESYFNKKNDGISIASDYQHFKYWMNHNLYVILFVYNPVTELCYWVDLTKYIMELDDTSNFRIKTKDINPFNTDTYHEFILYINDKIGDHKRNYMLSKTIKSIISMPSNDNNQKLRYGALNYRNEMFLWITVLYKLRTAVDKDTLRYLIEILNFISSNPDIFRSRYNIVDSDVLEEVTHELNNVLNEEIVCKILSTFETDEYCRGGIGQSVYHILELNQNISNYLINIIKNKNVSSNVRYNAWALYPIRREKYEDELHIKKELLETIHQANVIDLITRNLFREILETQGLFYYD